MEPDVLPVSMVELFIVEVVLVPSVIDNQVPAVGSVLVHVSLALVSLVTAHGAFLGVETIAGSRAS